MLYKFTFDSDIDVSVFCVQNVTLKLTVVVPWHIGHRRKVIGFVELGKNVDSVSPTDHWRQMLANPRRPMAAWHQLRDVIDE